MTLPLNDATDLCAVGTAQGEDKLELIFPSIIDDWKDAAEDFLSAIRSVGKLVDIIDLASDALTPERMKVSVGVDLDGEEGPDLTLELITKRSMLQASLRALRDEAKTPKHDSRRHERRVVNEREAVSITKPQQPCGNGSGGRHGRGGHEQRIYRRR